MNNTADSTRPKGSSMFQPANGDHVQLTRVHADGHTSRTIGTISEMSPGGFRLTGHNGTRSVDSYYATDMTHPRSGVTSQTITPAVREDQ